jgi:hypothetical protein
VTFVANRHQNVRNKRNLELVSSEVAQELEEPWRSLRLILTLHARDHNGIISSSFKKSAWAGLPDLCVSWSKVQSLKWLQKFTRERAGWIVKGSPLLKNQEDDLRCTSLFEKLNLPA